MQKGPVLWWCCLVGSGNISMSRCSQPYLSVLHIWAPINAGSQVSYEISHLWEKFYTWNRAQYVLYIINILLVYNITFMFIHIWCTFIDAKKLYLATVLFDFICTAIAATLNFHLFIPLVE